MKILVADKFEKSGIDALQAAACDVESQPDLKDDSLTAAIRESDADALVVRSTRVTDTMLGAGRLKLVVRAGAGYNTIDVAAASRRGVQVANCPGKNAIAVAELAFGLLLALDRRIPDNVAELRAGRWNKKEFSKAAGLYGKTLGLLGIGSIGQEMAIRAAAFGMSMVIWSRRFDDQDRPVTAEEARALRLEEAHRQVSVSLAPTPAAVAGRCDVLSVHLAASKDTKGLVDAEVLSRLKPGAFFINTARGEVVDYGALEAAVKEKGIRVALDVYGAEPASSTGEFADNSRESAQCLWHASHRCVDRPGPGSDCGRDRSGHLHVQGDRQGAQRRQSVSAWCIRTSPGAGSPERQDVTFQRLEGLRWRLLPVSSTSRRDPPHCRSRCSRRRSAT